MSDRTAQRGDRGSRFTVRDLHVYNDRDALAWLGERESTFFRAGAFNPPEAVLLLGVEALDSGVQEVSVERSCRSAPGRCYLSHEPSFTGTSIRLSSACCGSWKSCGAAS